MSRREFFSTHKAERLYETITLDHPDAGIRRFVKNEFFPQVFDGETYEGASMEITESAQEDAPVTTVDVQMGRVGLQAKEYIQLIDRTNAGWIKPIKATLAQYTESDRNNPLYPPYELQVSNLSIDGQNFAMSLQDDNPMGIQVAKRYNPIDQPGLGDII